MKILLFKAHEGDPLSLVIREVTQSPYVHAAVLVDAGSPWRKVFGALCGLRVSQLDSSPMIVELYWDRARARFLTPDEPSNIDVFEVIAWNEADDELAMEYAAQAIRDEIKYDIPDLFRFLPTARLIMGSASEDAAKRHMFCSFFVVQLCLAAGRQILRVNGAEVAPGQLTWAMEVIPSNPLALSNS